MILPLSVFLMLSCLCEDQDRLYLRASDERRKKFSGSFTNKYNLFYLYLIVSELFFPFLCIHEIQHMNTHTSSFSNTKSNYIHSCVYIRTTYIFKQLLYGKHLFFFRFSFAAFGPGGKILHKRY